MGAFLMVPLFGFQTKPKGKPPYGEFLKKPTPQTVPTGRSPKAQGPRHTSHRELGDAVRCTPALRHRCHHQLGCSQLLPPSASAGPFEADVHMKASERRAPFEMVGFLSASFWLGLSLTRRARLHCMPRTTSTMQALRCSAARLDLLRA